LLKDVEDSLACEIQIPPFSEPLSLLKFRGLIKNIRQNLPNYIFVNSQSKAPFTHEQEADFLVEEIIIDPNIIYIKFNFE